MLNVLLAIVMGAIKAGVYAYTYAEEAAYQVKRHNRLSPTLGTVLVTWLGLLLIVVVLAEKAGVIS